MVDSWVTKKLRTASPSVFGLYCMTAAFGTYFCMYAFRKPFTAATYPDVVWLGLGLKSLLIISQVAGYALSKFIGIKIVSEMPARKRAITILGLIGMAEFALLLFAYTPAPWNCVWLFINGLPLGMVFGLVLGFLEGRQTTEALAAGLCASFIVASGFVKSVGRAMIDDLGVETSWMPVTTGLIFVAPLLLFVWLLAQIPPPNAEDTVIRQPRRPMKASERKQFFTKYAASLIALITIYVLLSIARSVRDDFAVEIWADLGTTNTPSVFAISEFWIAVLIMIACGFSVFIRNNRTALFSTLIALAVGFLVTLVATTGHSLGFLSPMGFMILLGFGMYLPYVVFHTTIFERMIAVSGEPANVGFLMYLADAAGYLGYVAVLLFKNFETKDLNYLSMLKAISLIVGIISVLLTGWLFLHFSKRFRQQVGTHGGDN